MILARNVVQRSQVINSEMISLEISFIPAVWSRSFPSDPRMRDELCAGVGVGGWGGGGGQSRS